MGQELVRKGVNKEDIEHGLREVFGTDSHKLHVHIEDLEEDEDGMGESHSEHAPLIFHVAQSIADM